LACPNCTRLEKAIYELVRFDPTGGSTFQLMANAGTLPISQEQAKVLDRLGTQGTEMLAVEAVKAKRKASPYAKRYGRAFKKVAKKYQKKSGGWMKNGFKRAQREAHKIARKGK
jgi:hypothetical protein